jgi:transposase-like protein
MARQAEDTKLLDLWQEGFDEADGGIRHLLETVVQRVLEEELTGFLGAEAYERTDGRAGYRNGYKPRQLRTRVGTLELLVPKDREGRFSTTLFERYQRSEKALLLAVAEMYVQGVSTRKVKEITEALCGLEISKTQVSELAKGLDAEVDAWRSRRLEKTYPYLIVDARYEKVRKGPQVVSCGVLIVVGISEDGYREILGTYTAPAENDTTWAEVFRDLEDRGLRGVRFVVSDDHKGLRAAIERHFSGALWQRCQVHFLRNVLGHVSKKDRKWAVDLMRAITNAATRTEARKQLQAAVAAFEERYPTVAALLDEHGEEMLAVYELPDPHRKRMRTTNLLERENEELKRRTRVVRIFPNEASCLRLVTVLAMETSEEWQDRRYLDMSAEKTEAEGTEETKTAA